MEAFSSGDAIYEKMQFEAQREARGLQPVGGFREDLEAQLAGCQKRLADTEALRLNADREADRLRLEAKV